VPWKKSSRSTGRRGTFPQTRTVIVSKVWSEYSDLSIPTPSHLENGLDSAPKTFQYPTVFQMSHLNRCKIKSHRCPAGFAESVPPVFFVTNKQNEFALTSSVPGETREEWLLTNHLFVLSKKQQQNSRPNLLNHLFSSDFNFMLFSSSHNAEISFSIGHFCVQMRMRMNINRELVKRMVHSVFGVVWSVYNEWLIITCPDIQNIV